MVIHILSCGFDGFLFILMGFQISTLHCEIGFSQQHQILMSEAFHGVHARRGIYDTSISGLSIHDSIIISDVQILNVGLGLQPFLCMQYCSAGG